MKPFWLLPGIIVCCLAVLFVFSWDKEVDSLDQAVKRTTNDLIAGQIPDPDAIRFSTSREPPDSMAQPRVTNAQLNRISSTIRENFFAESVDALGPNERLSATLKTGLEILEETSVTPPVEVTFSPQSRLVGVYPQLSVSGVNLNAPDSFSVVVSEQIKKNPDLFLHGGDFEQSSIDSSCSRLMCLTIVNRTYKGVPAWDYSLSFTASEKNVIAIQGEFGVPHLSSEPFRKMEDEEYLNLVSEHYQVGSESIALESPIEFGIDRYGAHDYFALKAVVSVGNGERSIVYVSQESRLVIRSSTLTHSVGVPAQGQNLLGEVIEFQAEVIGSQYEMRDTRYPKNAYTDIRDHSTTVYADNFLVPHPLNSDRDETILKSNQSDSGWEPAGVSALQGTKELYEYFELEHGFPESGDLFPVSIFVNGDYSNAFSFGNGKFAYGRGDGVSTNNFTIAKDVIAHEVTHGVISAPGMSNLEYEFESGALNESLADFFGIRIDDSNWELGEAIFNGSRAIRSMSSPQSYGQPGHYSQRVRVGKNNDHGGVHTNSGIPNRMFYLLSEGLSNEGIGNSIGIEKTADLAYILIKNLRPTKATLQQASDLMIQSAREIYGANSLEANSVIDAWSAVGIPDERVSFSDLETGTPEKPTNNALLYLYPNESVELFGTTSNTFSLYLQFYSSALKSFEPDFNLGPLNQYQAKYTRPTIAPKEDGTVIVAYQDNAGTFQLYNSAIEETNALEVDDLSFSAIAVSTDSKFFAFTLTYSPVIYVFNLEDESWSSVTVRKPSYTEGLDGIAVEYIDTLVFDPTGRELVFDFLTCEEVEEGSCSSDQSGKYWSIGTLDILDMTLNFPFPQQSSRFDLGFPNFNNLDNRYLIFDLIDRQADTDSGVLSLVTIYELSTKSFRVVALSDLTSNATGYFGVPSFSADDTGVIHTIRFDSGQSRIYFQDIVDYDVEEFGSGWHDLNPYQAFLPVSVPTVTIDKKPILQLDTYYIDFGVVIIGSKARSRICVSNSGEFSIGMKGVNSDEELISWDGTGYELEADTSYCGDIIFDSEGKSTGAIVSTFSLAHNGANGPTPIVYSVFLDIDTDNDGIGNNADDDDDNDNVLDINDDLPLDASESVDSDGDGIGNNADTDDDNDGVADSADPWPYDSRYSSDSDNDGLPDAYEFANGLNPTNAGDASTDTDGDGLTVLEEFQYGTSDTNTDSDFDTLPDKWEVSNGRNGVKADYLVSAGYKHSCVLDDGGVRCWGYNHLGQNNVPVLENPTELVAGLYHTCAIDDTGIVCWGNNGNGQSDVPELSNPTQVSAGYYHTCAIDDTGIVCWGNNGNGQSTVPALSNPRQVSAGQHHSCAVDDSGVICWGIIDPEDGEDSGESDPPALSNVEQVGVGYSHTCALHDSEVTCWGDNEEGQTDVPELSNPVQLTTGRYHSCVLDDFGVVCWGNNGSGQTDFPLLRNPRQVSGGAYHTCALDDTGIVCSGFNDYGQTDIPLNNPILTSAGRNHSCAIDDSGVFCWGYNDLGQTSVPEDLSKPTLVASTYAHTCAIDDNGVVCWGNNFNGQTDVPSLDAPQQVGTGQWHTCALDDSGVMCWGYNGDGQGDVPTLNNPTQLSVGYRHSCAVDDSGVQCWGYNEDGQIDVPTLTDATEVSAGSQHTCALDESGVTCWGDNGIGQTSVPDLSNPAQLATGGYHTCVMDDSGVVCWGNNGNGQTDVPALSNPTDLSVGAWHTCAIDDTGAVCWGYNGQGQVDVPLMFDPDGDGVTNQNRRDALPLDATETQDTDGDGVGNNADTDDDGDGTDDSEDAFPLDSTEWIDTDGDGVGNNADTDDDNDEVLDVNDAFALISLGGLTDTDGDGRPNDCDSSCQSAGMAADTDDDNDEVLDVNDAFALISLGGLTDTDGDGRPNDCDSTCQSAGMSPDTDDDNDEILDTNDAFPLDSTESMDTDGDGTGNNADTDDDGDEVLDTNDAFPLDATESIDTDGDGTGNNADTDDDNDEVLDTNDAFPLDATESIDTDGDGVGNNADTDDDGDEVLDTNDAFPLDATESIDTDGDGAGNNADTDDDGDEVLDTNDAFPLDATESIDTDGDGTGNNADTDDDGDEVLDTNDAFPLDATESIDTDGDGIGNNADSDDDNDEILDTNDAFPLDSTESMDTDGDGTGNNADTDDDGDEVLDTNDAFPLDATESIDTDGDGVGNNADSDDDGDGLNDTDEGFYGTDPLLADTDSDGVSDSRDDLPLDETETIDTDNDGIGNNADEDDDGDNLSDSAENGLGTDPLIADSDGDGTDDGADAFPLNAAESADSDEDGVGDNADVFPEDATETVDADSDGVGDNADLFDDDPSEAFDYDLDGIGNNTDLDDDDDGFSDLDEEEAGTDPLNASSCPGCFTWDIDADGEAKPLTDGLLVIRYLFGFSGDSLTAGAIGGTAQRTSADYIMAYLSDAESELDIDGDGEATPLTDGLVLIRSLFGFSGDSLISGAIGGNAQRTTAEDVSAYIEQRMP
jgi:Zn-dependent metalloprotease/alpha-tubulin suppressor-like RCC1 family protein